MTFQKTTSIIFGLILILLLIIFAISLYYNKNKNFSNIIADCPDYWEAQNINNINQCVNTKNLGKSNCSKTMNFNTYPWNTNAGICNKYTWANKCDLSWDGITNNKKSCN